MCPEEGTFVCLCAECVGGHMGAGVYGGQRTDTLRHCPLGAIYFLYLEAPLFRCMCACVCVHVCACTRVNSHAMLCVWRPEDDFYESYLSFHCVSPRVQTQVVRVGNKHPY